MTTTTDRPLFSLVYVSTATEPFDEKALQELLRRSRAANDAAGLTGLLLYRDGRFIQFLEGEEPAVRQLVGRIAADRRHGRIRTLLEDDIDRRQFAEWTMGFAAPADDDMPDGFRRSFDDLDAGRDRDLMAQAARELTMWFRQRPREASAAW